MNHGNFAYKYVNHLLIYYFTYLVICCTLTKVYGVNVVVCVLRCENVYRLSVLDIKIVFFLTCFY